MAAPAPSRPAQVTRSPRPTILRLRGNADLKEVGEAVRVWFRAMDIVLALDVSVS